MEFIFKNPLEASLFCLQNLSTAPPMKQTGGDKGEPLLAVKEGAVAPLFARVSGAVLALCFLGNTFCQWGKSVTSSKEGKLQGVNLFLHFSRENFEGLEKTREYLSHNMTVTRFRRNNYQLVQMDPKLLKYP